MEPREPTPADAERLAELVRSAMTTSYRLSPEEIDQLVAEQFEEDALAEKVDSEDTVVRVLEDDGEEPDETEAAVLAGYVEGTVEDGRGELRWLFIDPEHRGKGLGTKLYETGMDALREAGAEQLLATTLEANAEGQGFFERFGLEQVDDRRIELGDQSLVEYVYADPSTVDADATDVTDAESGSADDEPADSTAEAKGRSSGDEVSGSPPAVEDLELPGTETSGETTDAAGTTTAMTEDGTTVFLALDERESGTNAPFFAAYTDEDHADRYGYYCANCGSLDVTMDSADRIECEECGNGHAERSSEAYDDSYL